MLDLWIQNNIATQLWRGHLAPAIHLNANGLRQGCVLSPILYLLIINALVAEAPSTTMPEWDDGFMATVFQQGVQPLRYRTDLTEWLVYLFVDDTAFVSKDIHTTNELLSKYHNFTRKWRIRVNSDKCKILKNHFCEGMGDGLMGDKIIRAVEYLKYLGYWIGTKGRGKNDDHVKAYATQLRFKIRILRDKLGEHMAKIYLESYATPSVLHGIELGNLPSATLDSFHAWSISEVLGIGRLGKSAGLMEGEVRTLCVFSDYHGPTWSQIRVRNAMVTHRSIMRMHDSTLPKQMAVKQGENTTLFKNIMKKLGGGKLTPAERLYKLNLCKTLNSGLAHAKSQWKLRIQKFQRKEYNTWIHDLHLNLCKDVNKRQSQSIQKHVLNLGIGTAYLMSLNMGSHLTITHVNSKLQASLKLAIRKLKAGMINHLLIMKHMYDGKWHKTDFEAKLDAIMCPCSTGIQDVHHIIIDCECTSHLLNNWLLQSEEAMVRLISNKKLPESHLHDFMQLSDIQKISFMIHRPYASKGSETLAHEYGLTAQSYLKALTDFVKTLNTSDSISDPTSAPMHAH
jgi:hypothetical protein